MGNLLTALKEIFSGSSQTSPTNIPTCASDGTPNGNINMANLASVLGGENPRIDNGDYDNFPTGVVFAASNCANRPSDSFFFVRTYDSGYDKTQLAYGISNHIFFRCKWYGEETWSAWMEVSHDIPTFYKSYADLPSLANALGVFIPIEFPQNGVNSVNWNAVKALTYNWITNWYNDMSGDTQSAGVMIHFRNAGMSSMNDLYINFLYSGGIRHSYDLESWVND